MHISRGQVLAILRETVQESDKAAGTGRSERLLVDPADRHALIQWIRGGRTSPRIVIRSVVILLAGGGWTNSQISAQLGVSRRTVALWKQRYRSNGARSVLADAPGRGRKPGRNRHIVSRILATTQQAPPNGARWTVRTLARTVGVSHATVQRVWREHGISAATARA